MQNSARKKAKRFLTEYNLQEVSLESIKDILKSQGYTLVEFNSLYNEEDVATLIDSLNLKTVIEQSRGFTYVDKYRRLVFINEGLSDEEKLVLLVHEEGHIFCGHFSATPIIGKDVIEEHEANEFSHYILNPSIIQKCRRTIKRHKRVWSILGVMCIILILVISIGALIQKETSYYGDYYVTSSGNKYHENECIFVKDKTNVRRITKEEFESGDYEACGICLPNQSP